MSLQQSRAGMAAGPLTAILVLIGSASAAQPAPSRATSGPHVSVEIVTDAERVQEGVHWLGLRFTLEPGWHIYWQNPGDSGGPPEVRWQTPAAMVVGPVEWPAPERIEADGLVNYGYHGTVILPAQLAIAADAPTSPAAIRASVRWLVCRNLCVAGNGTVELAWPLGAADRVQVASWTAAISEARARVPKPAPATWEAAATASPAAFTISVRTGQPEAAVTFFPLDVSQIDDAAAQEVMPRADGVQIRLQRSAQLVKDPLRLRGIVSFPDGRAFEVIAPLLR